MFHAFTRTAALTAALAATLSAGLMTPAPAQAAVPTIVALACPLDNGGGRFYCHLEYNYGSPATVAWSGSGSTFNAPGSSDFYGYCNINYQHRVTVTITNASGTTSRTTAYFKCKGGPVIL